MRFKLNDVQVTLNICKLMQQLDGMKVVSIIDTIDDEVDAVKILIEDKLGVYALSAVIMNFNGEELRSTMR